jgi:hypothetical protein
LWLDDFRDFGHGLPCFMSTFAEIQLM